MEYIISDLMFDVTAHLFYNELRIAMTGQIKDLRKGKGLYDDGVQVGVGAGSDMPFLQSYNY